MLLDRSWRLMLISVSMSAFWLIAVPADAQVRADDTLPNRSIVERRGNDRFVITEGTQADQNLFHSLETFSIPENGRASFRGIDPTVENIFTRVTGDRLSQIDGEIEVLSDANFFLINPNGILFGENASLDLRGSFLATTAESIVFEDGTLFSSREPQPNVLTISTPIGLQFGQEPGDIRNESIFNLDFNQGTVDGLVVDPGQTLALVGGEIVVEGGVLFAPEGRIELGSVASPDFVSLTAIDNGWTLGYDEVEQFADIKFSGNLIPAIVDTSGQFAGTVQIQGNNVSFTDGSFIAANGQSGGAVQISASELSLADNSSIISITRGETDGEPIQIQADSVFMSDTSLISTSTNGVGDAGDISIEAQQVTIQGDGVLRGQDPEDDAQVSSLTRGTGDTGTLSISADRIELSDGAGLFTQVAEAATGNGGELFVSANSLDILDGAQISTTTFGIGDAGLLRVQAETVEISGSLLEADGNLFIDRSGRIALPISSGLYTGTERDSSGDGGDLVLTADRLTLRDGGVLQSTTFGEGDAGDVVVQISDRIEIIGTDAEGLFPSSITAASGGIANVVAQEGVEDATGKGGTIQIQTDELLLVDEGTIAVGSLNPDIDSGASAGNLVIAAESVFLENQGRLLAETASGDGGNVTLRQVDDLVLRDQSLISTTAGTDETGGNGGDIRINADFILSVLSENNDITANAFEGDGGNVNITTESIIGIEFQLEQTLNSDITASSEFGLDGEVIISTLEIDPTQGVVELPGQLVDASQLVGQACPNSGDAIATASGEFYVVGRGGLPQSPYESLSSETLIADWISLENGAVEAIDREPELSTAPIVEAQGWMTSPDGEVVLTAQESEAQPYSPIFVPASCFPNMQASRF